MRVRVLGGIIALAAAGIAAAAAGSDQIDELGAYGKQFQRAVQLEDRGDTTGAIRAYQQLIDRSQDVAIPYYFLGNLYWDTGQQAKAREQFRKGAEACPG